MMSACAYCAGHYTTSLAPVSGVEASPFSRARTEAAQAAAAATTTSRSGGWTAWLVREAQLRAAGLPEALILWLRVMTGEEWVGAEQKLVVPGRIIFICRDEDEEGEEEKEGATAATGTTTGQQPQDHEHRHILHHPRVSKQQQQSNNQVGPAGAAGTIMAPPSSSAAPVVAEARYCLRRLRPCQLRHIVVSQTMDSDHATGEYLKGLASIVPLLITAAAAVEPVVLE